MKYLLILLTTLSIASCNWTKEKTKDAINSTGQAVGKAGSEFADGVSKGVEKTFQNQVVVSDQLKKTGIEVGKITIHGTDSTSNNILTTYLIFDTSFTQDICIKILDDAGQEYGRATQTVTGQKGEGKYIDFVFDKRTNIEDKGKLLFDSK